MTTLPAALRRQCEAIATERRALLGLHAFDRLRADDLARDLGAIVHYPHTLPDFEPHHVATLLASDQWSGALIRREPPFIVLNPRHSLARRESDLMHELAHVLLGHAMVHFDPKTDLPARRPEDEEEACYLGGCLQIPRRGLLWALQCGMTVPQVAAHFGASEDMVVYRSRVTRVPVNTTR